MKYNEILPTVAYKYSTRRHVILEKSNEEDIDHLIRRLATSRQQISKEKVLAKIRSHSPKHKQIKKPYSPDIAETAATNISITTSSTPHTSRNHKNLRPTKGKSLPKKERV